MKIRYAEMCAAAAMLFWVVGAIATATADEPIAVPQLNDIVIDGTVADWADSGFVLDVLVPRNGAVIPASDFSGRYRLGWDARGVLVVAVIQDDKYIEMPNEYPWTVDSLEVYVAGTHNAKGTFQVLITPGLNAKDPGLKVYQYDRRGGKPIEAEVKAAAKAIEGGYVIEALLPWETMGVEPTIGTAIAMNLQSNDRDAYESGRRYELAWYPSGWSAYEVSSMYKLVLADKADPPMQFNVRRTMARSMRDIDVLVVAAAGQVGKMVEVVRGDHVIAGKPLVDREGVVCIRLLVPTATSAAEPATIVRVGEQVIATIPFEDPSAAILGAIETAELSYQAVIDGDAFGPIDFASPGWIESLVGPYELDVDYYSADMQKAAAPDSPGRYGAVVTIRAQDFGPVHRYLTLYKTPGKANWGRGDSLTITLPPGLGIDQRVAEANQSQTDQWARSRVIGRRGADEGAAIYLAGLHERSPEQAGPAVGPESPQQINTAWWLKLRKKLSQFEHRYLTRLPDGYADEPGRKWPLVICLHGAAERGRDLTEIESLLTMVNGGAKYPFILVAPQCDPHSRWQPCQVIDLLDEAIAKYRVDESRVYLTGMSMGGAGTWATATYYPDRFAAVVPICGRGDVALAGRLVGKPIWAFHGDADATVHPRYSKQMVEAIGANGGEAKLTIYPGVGHDCWTQTYKRDDLYEWLFSQRKSD